jgi:hypothetical protein
MGDGDSKCGPFSNKKYTCYTDDSLVKMRDKWNILHPDDMILYDTSKKIWDHFRSRFNDVCSIEKCWLRKIFSGDNREAGGIETETFAPKKPSKWKKNPREWLTSIDISRVMSQYESKYKSFAFLGAVPVDFAGTLKNNRCVVDDLCVFDIKKYMDRGKTSFGMAINTDPHTKGGEHWTSLYIDISNNKASITFFDSSGIEPMDEVYDFADNIEEQLEPLGIKCKLYYNEKRHQYSRSECGMYTIYFLSHMLNGKLSKFKINNMVIPDKEMIKMRNHFFG